MGIDSARARRYLQTFDFQKLFVEELGWDYYTTPLEVRIDGAVASLAPIAEKRGMVALVCPPLDGGRVPPYVLRRKIEGQVAKTIHEHVLVYLDASKTTQIWQWVKREPGRPAACREISFQKGQTGQALIEKFGQIAFSLDEEATLNIVEVAGRVRAAFDVERVTKQFYKRFEDEHRRFLGFIKGIPDEELQRWYASVMLNRLMFIYFIQKRGFLNGDQDYLRNRLAWSKRIGSDRYYTGFLCPLFFEGFAQEQQHRSPEIRQLLGDVPYLSGSIFLKHQIEELHGQRIQIADAAFERLFEFFDQYHWHLDERPLRRDDEINPDVLGYIFEKYINQKEMGAYYTKDDITGYIARNTVIPFVLDRARQDCRIAFEGEHSVWRLLQVDPDRYIYPAMRKGNEDQPWPEFVIPGIKDVSRRDGWNSPAASEVALPTETWREYVTRRQRYEETWSKLLDGEIHEVDDLITYNLDIHQFAQDVIETCEGPDLLRAIWKAIKGVTILDPTCGSGAFLFAALNILEPLYEACLDRMQAFLDELDRSGEKHHPEKLGDFRKTLQEAERHPNRAYFILKSIIVNNLYGVDIMEEAVEICKLRLFLKLVAQVDKDTGKPNFGIEPLPDIDFNIRAGNTLVGFATAEAVKTAMKMADHGQIRMLSDEDRETYRRFEERAEIADRAFRRFRWMQTEQGMQSEDFAEAKQALREQLKSLDAELSSHLATEYGVETPASPAYRRWLDSHRPFHWLVEFYGIMNNGGFDLIIGNPPYVEYSRVRDSYTVRGYRSTTSGNLYAYVLERSFHLVGDRGRVGEIVPLSLVCTDRMESIRQQVLERASWISAFDMRPNSLFEGVSQRLCIVLSSWSRRSLSDLYTAGYRRWASEERPFLMHTTTFVRSAGHHTPASPISKFSDGLEQKVFAKISGQPLSAFVDERADSVYVHRIVRYFVKAIDFVPLFTDPDGGQGRSEDYKEFRFGNGQREMIAAMLNSSLFYWFWRTHADGFHCGYKDVFLMPWRPPEPEDIPTRLRGMQRDLMASLREASREKTISTKRGKIRYQEFYPKLSKPIIDEIDRILAQHYGFTDEELDFIINYDIKYRMGRETGEE